MPRFTDDQGRPTSALRSTGSGKNGNKGSIETVLPAEVSREANLAVGERLAWWINNGVICAEKVDQPEMIYNDDRVVVIQDGVERIFIPQTAPEPATT